MAAWEIQGRDALSSTSGVNGNTWDSSGFNINFGSGSLSAERTQSTASPGAVTLDAYLPYVGIAVAVLIAWRMMRKR